MELDLTRTETRVLGCLVEKDLATPEYYPLTLNALTNACNQKSNRDPLMQLARHRRGPGSRQPQAQAAGPPVSGRRAGREVLP